MNELEYVGLVIFPTRDLDSVCNIPIALFKAGFVAGVDPEDPCLGQSLSDLVCVFDGKLRLTSQMLAAGLDAPGTAHPTPPRPTSAVRDAGGEDFSWT
jgi:hypothetical protein